MAVLDGETLPQCVKIAPNLAAGVRIADTWVTVTYSDKDSHEGRTRWQWEIIFPDNESVVGDDLYSGCQGGNLVEGLECLLSFMVAHAEALNYQDRTGNAPENADLFDNKRVSEFCQQYSDELAMEQMNISDT